MADDSDLECEFVKTVSGGSASDRTSLFALRNLVNWRDVVTDSNCRPAQCKRFINLVLDAEIIAAAFHFFGMESIEDAPSKHGFSDTMTSRVAVVKRRNLSSIVRQFLQEYVLDTGLYSAHFQNINSLEEWEAAVNGHAHCRWQHDEVSKRRHKMSHDPPPDVITEPVLSNTVPDPDVKNDETVNDKRGLGNNVFMDLDLEHDNHGLKDIKGVLGANISEGSVTIICKAFFKMKKLSQIFNKEIGVNQVSGDHTKKYIKQDLLKIVRLLKGENVFTNAEARKTMRGFPKCPRDYLQLLNTGTLFKWIN
ncbi:hypothetical protein OS493_006922 [Desmophyllum pertusum]|uniref:Uncharacterized protein n=1 Tax=Desmophyllum pertusum TaxID=174260 RepID=A0A9W9ZTP4_9CNID|nr:hypothetical protein OS493_006922 [Desmophyllum pertusum]